MYRKREIDHRLSNSVAANGGYLLKAHQPPWSEALNDLYPTLWRVQ
jgi:hypothetical protein